MAEKQTVLFKYLDIEGAKKMLANSNIQFTRATDLNDPFDCHPGLIENSDEWPNEITPARLGYIEKHSGMGYFSSQFRSYTTLCCLSKKFDSILMWSYYAQKHSGICVGLNKQKINGYIIPCIDFEVQYPDILTKYNCSIGTNEEAFKHQLTTKAPEWKHEYEVRLLGPPTLQYRTHHHYKIGGECFVSIYLGVNMTPQEKETIIYIARKLNPDIKIYQMQVNPDAFTLIYTEINKV